MSVITSELNQLGTVQRATAPAGALSGTLSASATTLTLGSGEGSAFPSGSFVVGIDSEQIGVAARTGDVLTVAQRGANATTAASHAAAAPVTGVADFYGNTLRNWATHGTEACRVMALTGKELDAGPAAVVKGSHRGYFENSADVLESDRVLVGSETFEVQFVDSAPGGEKTHKEVLMTVVRGN